MKSVEKSIESAPVDDTQAVLANDVRIGRRLRALRKERALSLNELALKARVSASMLSQTERGLANPSIKIIQRVRQALDVPLTALLEDAISIAPIHANQHHGSDATSHARASGMHEYVRRVADRPFFQSDDNTIRKELLTPHGAHDLEFMIIVLAPQCRSEDVLIGPGEKAGMVLDGDIVLEVDGELARLSTGDSFQFNSALKHSVRNESAQTARVLWIMNTKVPVVRF